MGIEALIDSHLEAMLTADEFNMRKLALDLQKELSERGVLPTFNNFIIYGGHAQRVRKFFGHKRWQRFEEIWGRIEKEWNERLKDRPLSKRRTDV